MSGSHSVQVELPSFGPKRETGIRPGPIDTCHPMIVRYSRMHGSGQMTAAAFPTIALSLERVEEYSHAGLPAFRVGGRKFASLGSQAEGYGNLMLTLEQQAAFVEEAPEVFLPWRSQPPARLSPSRSSCPDLPRPLQGLIATGRWLSGGLSSFNRLSGVKTAGPGLPSAFQIARSGAQ